MKKPSFGTICALVATSAATGALALQFVGCGGDDNSSVNQTDASQSSPDTSMGDDGSPQPTDSSTSPDSPVTTPDAEAGTMPPIADAGPDGEPEGGGNPEASTCSITLPTSANFISVVATTVCQSLKTCCGTGARFDTATCLSTYENPAFGGWMGDGYVQAYMDGGRVAYDTSAACDCLQRNATISCGLVPQETWNSIANSCIGAVHGAVGTTLADAGDGGDAGSTACGASFECAPGGYCTTQNASDPGGGPLGNCIPLVPDGGACPSDLACSYLANGTPALYCDQTSHTCVPRFDAGATCQTNAQCALNNCTSSSCQSGIVFSDQVGSGGICDFFTLKDGG